MEHSIAAKYAARPAASFPRPSVRVRERRLGLRSAIAFRATSGRQSVLRRQASTLAQLRGGSRAITPTHARRVVSGRPRPIISMTWSRSVRIGGWSAASAPWLV
ncbi:MAG: hypothetical protein HY264_09320 [Chloroflexi bacterium]|nr:hypothetical protein [Chloroflexota bacterium]